MSSKTKTNKASAASEATNTLAPASNSPPPAIVTGLSEDGLPLIHSSKFMGDYTEDELQCLEAKYESIVREHGYEFTSDLDYAKKAAIASMNADELQAKYVRGKATMKQVKEAVELYDTLMKSMNLAACKTKADTTAANDMSACEMILTLMESGHYCNQKIEWEKDAVDKTVELFLHLDAAMHPADK